MLFFSDFAGPFQKCTCKANPNPFFSFFFFSLSPGAPTIDCHEPPCYSRQETATASFEQTIVAAIFVVSSLVALLILVPLCLFRSCSPPPENRFEEENEDVSSLDLDFKFETFGESPRTNFPNSHPAREKKRPPEVLGVRNGSWSAEERVIPRPRSQSNVQSNSWDFPSSNNPRSNPGLRDSPFYPSRAAGIPTLFSPQGVWNNRINFEARERQGRQRSKSEEVGNPPEPPPRTRSQTSHPDPFARPANLRQAKPLKTNNLVPAPISGNTAPSPPPRRHGTFGSAPRSNGHHNKIHSQAYKPALPPPRTSSENSSVPPLSSPRANDPRWRSTSLSSENAYPGVAEKSKPTYTMAHNRTQSAQSLQSNGLISVDMNNSVSVAAALRPASLPPQTAQQHEQAHKQRIRRYSESEEPHLKRSVYEQSIATPTQNGHNIDNLQSIYVSGPSIPAPTRALSPPSRLGHNLDSHQQHNNQRDLWQSPSEQDKQFKSLSLSQELQFGESVYDEFPLPRQREMVEMRERTNSRGHHHHHQGDILMGKMATEKSVARALNIHPEPVHNIQRPRSRTLSTDLADAVHQRQEDTRNAARHPLHVGKGLRPPRTITSETVDGIWRESFS